MKYLQIIILLILAIYPFNFARYNWNKNNKIGAVGAVLITVLMVVYPSILLLTR